MTVPPNRRMSEVADTAQLRAVLEQADQSTDLAGGAGPVGR